MFIRTWSFDDVAVLDVSGRLGIEEGRAFRATVSNVLRDGRRQLVVNRLGVSAMDASGLGALVDTLKEARAVGGDVKLGMPVALIEARWSLCADHSELSDLTKSAGVQAVDDQKEVGDRRARFLDD